MHKFLAGIDLHKLVVNQENVIELAQDAKFLLRIKECLLRLNLVEAVTDNGDQRVQHNDV